MCDQQQRAPRPYLGLLRRSAHPLCPPPVLLLFDALHCTPALPRTIACPPVPPLLSGLVSLRVGHPGMVALVPWHRSLRVSYASSVIFDFSFDALFDRKKLPPPPSLCVCWPPPYGARQSERVRRSRVSREHFQHGGPSLRPRRAARARGCPELPSAHHRRGRVGPCRGGWHGGWRSRCICRGGRAGFALLGAAVRGAPPGLFSRARSRIWRRALAPRGSNPIRVCLSACLPLTSVHLRTGHPLSAKLRATGRAAAGGARGGGAAAVPIRRDAPRVHAPLLCPRCAARRAGALPRALRQVRARRCVLLAVG